MENEGEYYWYIVYYSTVSYLPDIWPDNKEPKREMSSSVNSICDKTTTSWFPLKEMTKRLQGYGQTNNPHTVQENSLVIISFQRIPKETFDEFFKR